MYPGGILSVSMLNARELAIRDLEKNYRDALRRAKAWRQAASVKITEERRAFHEQARFEMNKARGYLRQARFLRKSELKGDDAA